LAKKPVAWDRWLVALMNLISWPSRTSSIRRRGFEITKSRELRFEVRLIEGAVELGLALV
jgi:hypothetical protein